MSAQILKAEKDVELFQYCLYRKNNSYSPPNTFLCKHLIHMESIFQNKSGENLDFLRNDYFSNDFVIQAN